MPLLTRSIKIISKDVLSKRSLKNRVLSKRLNIKQNTAKIKADFSMNFDFRFG